MTFKQPFLIKYGVPRISNLMDELLSKKRNNTLNKNEVKFLKKLIGCFKKLSSDPFYPSLNSHEISTLSQQFGKKIFESYLENGSPSAGRVFWTYGPQKGDITILAIEPHPTSNAAFSRINLDRLTD